MPGYCDPGRGSVQTVQDMTFEDEVLTIDNTLYSRCVLIHCTLEYSGGPVGFEYTQMRDCRYVFYGEARRTVHFLQGVGLLNDDEKKWTDFPVLLQ